MVSPIGASLVAAADALNPSIFTELWLVDEAGVDKTWFQGPSITTQALAHHKLKGIDLLAIPPRLQIAFLQSDDEASDRALTLLREIAKTLPHTPLKALGLNFDYLLAPPEGTDYAAFDRELLGPTQSPIFMHFASEDARFGAYFSKDVDGARLKLNIKPTTGSTEKGPSETLHFNFNFHVNLPPESKQARTDAICAATGRWPDYRDITSRVLECAQSYVVKG